MLDFFGPVRRVRGDFDVETLEISEMPEQQVAIRTTFIGLAESYEIRRIELKIRMQMKWADVVHFELYCPATNLADRM